MTGPLTRITKICSKWGLGWACLLVAFAAEGQPGSAVKRMYATYQIKLPGNIQVDSTGNEIPSADTLYTVFAETSTKSLHWICAWRNGIKYKLKARWLEATEITAGIREDNNEKMIIRVSGGGGLWQVRLMGSQAGGGVPQFKDPGVLMLKYSIGRKVFFKKAGQATRLKAIPSV